MERNDALKLVPLGEQFYRPSAEIVAPLLLGHFLIHETAEGVVGGIIVETEAYGQNDPACHASRGRTARNATMFGKAGLSYVYFIYGCHFCVNAVCCPEGIAEAVLIRALEPAFGLERMLVNRGVKREALTNGPGKLCSALGIKREANGLDLTDPTSPLRICRNTSQKQFIAEMGPVVSTTRIGITKAMDFPHRFYLERSTAVSRRITSP
ncbi:MAG: 3-methyladenine glycosylase [Verrucomicrobiales bacterium]|nr:3-methyladenine glycosylase [Verrucomicrobiales bacterium]